MKKTSTPRLLIFFATIAITLAVAVTMHSCKKDSTATERPNNIAAEMKQWLLSQKTDSLISITVDNLVSQVDWQSTHTLIADSSLTYEAALLNTTTSFDDVNKIEKRYLVLTKQNDKITDANIYELFGNKTDLTGKEDKAISNFNKSGIENFTGVITIYNWKNSFKQSKTYVNG